VPSSPRDKDATWRTLGKYCREFDRSRPRLIQELQNGLRNRTVPEGREIDWHNPSVLRSLDVEASTVTFGHVKVSEGHIGYVREVVGIEVLPPGAPTDGEVPAPAASPAPPRKVSKADVERCLRTIMAERPDNPPGEAELFAEMTRRLGASPGRDRLRQLRREIAPQWKRPIGAPRNFNSAKKYAV
jgi:hypothetical protein